MRGGANAASSAARGAAPAGGEGHACLSRLSAQTLSVRFVGAAFHRREACLLTTVWGDPWALRSASRVTAPSCRVLSAQCSTLSPADRPLKRNRSGKISSRFVKRNRSGKISSRFSERTCHSFSAAPATLTRWLQASANLVSTLGASFRRPVPGTPTHGSPSPPATAWRRRPALAPAGSMPPHTLCSIGSVLGVSAPRTGSHHSAPQPPCGSRRLSI